MLQDACDSILGYALVALALTCHAHASMRWRLNKRIVHGRSRGDSANGKAKAAATVHQPFALGLACGAATSAATASTSA